MQPMRTILVIGASGQLARTLQSHHRAFEAMEYRIDTRGRPALDLTRPETIDAHILAPKPSLVINTAAFTRVDDAEAQPGAAHQINAVGPALMAASCAKAEIPLIHISTDYVFDGKLGRPYSEADEASPVNSYGISKLDGEAAVLKEGGPAVILRTSWLYSAHAKNFLMNMLTSMSVDNKKQFEMVNDQRGCPTSADDLVTAIRQIILKGFGTSSGLFHVAGGGEATWHEFAEEIFKLTANYGWRPPTVTPITTAQRGAAAKRPADSRLDCTRVKQFFGVELPDWKQSLERTITAICTKGRMPGKQRNPHSANLIKNPGAKLMSPYPD